MIDAAIFRHNATCGRAVLWFKEKHGGPRQVGFATSSGAALDVLGENAAYVREWDKATGFSAFMKRVRSRSFRAQGFERCEDAPGWRLRKGGNGLTSEEIHHLQDVCIQAHHDFFAAHGGPVNLPEVKCKADMAALRRAEKQWRADSGYNAFVRKALLQAKRELGLA